MFWLVGFCRGRCYAKTFSLSNHMFNINPKILYKLNIRFFGIFAILLLVYVLLVLKGITNPLFLNLYLFSLFLWAIITSLLLIISLIRLIGVYQKTKEYGWKEKIYYLLFMLIIFLGLIFVFLNQIIKPMFF